MEVPAIKGIGGSLIYLIDQYYDTNPYNEEFDWIDKAHPEGVGFYYLDHLTHNVHKGNMDVWFRFYGDLFNFREIRFFDIEGKFTGLRSRALTSALRAHSHPDQRGPRRERADRRIPKALQWRGHPAYRGRGATTYTTATDEIAENGREVHAEPARDLLRPEL